MTPCYTSTFCMSKPVDKGVKTRRGSPVDNRPSTYKKREMKQLWDITIQIIASLQSFRQSKKSAVFCLAIFTPITTAAKRKCWMNTNLSLVIWKLLAGLGGIRTSNQQECPEWNKMGNLHWPSSNIRHKEFHSSVRPSSFVRDAQTTPPGFWNGVDWRALVED